MKNRIQWVVIALLIIVAFLMTFAKTPMEISSKLASIAVLVKVYSSVVHVLFLATVILGIFIKNARNTLYFLLIAYLSLSATIMSVMHMIIPNIIIFGLFFILIVHAYFTKKLHFVLRGNAPVNLFFGTVGLLCGFWYLHWVESPVLLNALLYSPLGSINCPTMVAICGFLCITGKPRSIMLEATVSLVTLYFGFFGVFFLNAYVDVVLIACSLFLILRLGSYMTFEDKLKQDHYVREPEPSPARS